MISANTLAEIKRLLTTFDYSCDPIHIDAIMANPAFHTLVELMASRAMIHTLAIGTADTQDLYEIAYMRGYAASIKDTVVLLQNFKTDYISAQADKNLPKETDDV